MKRTRMGLLAASLLALHLLVVSVAMSPTLHHLLHHDADALDHECAATLLIDGQIDRPEVARILAPQPLLRIEAPALAASSQVPAEFRDPSPGGRAPPLA